MQNLNLSVPTRRRSSRVSANVPVLVISKDPANRFSEICQTLVVSAHGCLFRSPMRFDSGTILQFHTEEGRQNSGRVVYCQAIESDQRNWQLAAQFDRPENFWGLKDHPKDWVVITAPASSTKLDKAASKGLHVVEPAPMAAALKDAIERIQQQVSDDNLRAVVAELVRPLQAEIFSLREKLANGEGRRSKFEVSLSQIPPELEEQIEARLRKELSPRILEHARQQASEVLEAARIAIAQKTRDGQQQFVQQIMQQTQGAENRVQKLAEENAAGLREQVRVAGRELQQRLAESGDRLKRITEEQLAAARRSLAEEYETRRRELQQAQASASAESTRLQTEVTELNTRIQRLDASVRRLESGLDKRLGEMATNTVSGVRARLEGEIDELLKSLDARGSQSVAKQLEHARDRIDEVRNEMEASVSATLQGQVAQAIDSFERSLDDSAEQSLAEWRGTLSRSLNGLLKSLGDELARETER